MVGEAVKVTINVKGETKEVKIKIREEEGPVILILTDPHPTDSIGYLIYFTIFTFTRHLATIRRRGCRICEMHDQMVINLVGEVTMIIIVISWLLRQA